MTDGEFWEYVFNGRRPGDPAPDMDEGPDEIVTAQLDPCPLCGERGPCGYDAEGRPMLHALCGEDEAP